jgi:hypothetical protein
LLDNPLIKKRTSLKGHCFVSFLRGAKFSEVSRAEESILYLSIAGRKTLGNSSLKSRYSVGNLKDKATHFLDRYTNSSKSIFQKGLTDEIESLKAFLVSQPF